MISFSWSVFLLISVLASHYRVLSPLWDYKRFQITNFLSSHLCQFKFIKCWGQDTSHHSLMFDQSVRAAINNKTCRWFLKVKIPWNLFGDPQMRWDSDKPSYSPLLSLPFMKPWRLNTNYNGDHLTGPGRQLHIFIIRATKYNSTIRDWIQQANY